MLYKTNLTLNKRQQLKAQMDDFATFQWRGHDMFDDFGCFIINDKSGSLKFYNGPGFSNQYAKPQFSKSVNGLLGVDWKQQTIPMKVGLYWFTIEEYQEFLNCINPYEVNYLTFNYAPDYGYLVKLGKIADSTRHIVGRNENGDIVYYTEMDLTWELVGDACVRSNTPYEYKRREESYVLDCYTWEFDHEKSDMQDDSLLDTGVIFEIPLEFNKNTANLSFKAFYETENENKYANLFEIDLENLTYSGNNDSPDVPNEPGDDTIRYLVKWVVDGKVVFEEYVIEGGSVTAPVVSDVPDGYVITGWEPNSFTNIQSNMIFTAVLQEIDPGSEPSSLVGTVWKIKTTPEKPSGIDYCNLNILSNNKQFELILFNVDKVQYVDSNEDFFTATATNEYSTFTILGGIDVEKATTVEFLQTIADRVSEPDTPDVPEPTEKGDWSILPSSEITIPEKGTSIQLKGTAYKANGESSDFSGILLYSGKWAFNINTVISVIYDSKTGETGDWSSFKFDDPSQLTAAQIESLKCFASNDDYPDTPASDDPNGLIGTTWQVVTPTESGEILGINFTSNGEPFIGIQCPLDEQGNITVKFITKDGEYVSAYSPGSGEAIPPYERFTITGGPQLKEQSTLEFLKTMAVQVTDEPEPDTPDDPYNLIDTTWKVIKPTAEGEITGINFISNTKSFVGIKCASDGEGIATSFKREDGTYVTAYSAAADDIFYEQFTITGGDKLNDVAVFNFLKTMATQITDEPDIPDEPAVKYTVNFYDYNGEVIQSSQSENNQFEEGAKVSPPQESTVIPTDKKYLRRIGWSTNEYENVKRNLDIYPILEYGYKRVLNTTLEYIADYIPLEFVYNNTIFTSISAEWGANGILAGYRFVGESDSIPISNGEVLNSAITIYVFDEYTALSSDTQLWLVQNTNLAPGERLIGPSIVNDLGYYDGSKYSISGSTFGWTILDDVTEAAYNIKDIKNAIYCPCQHEGKTYTHWTKIKKYDTTTDYLLVLMNFTDKSVCAIETNTTAPRALKVSFDDNNNTTQYVEYGTEVTPPNYAIDWNARIIGWNSDNEQSIYSVKAHTTFYPETEYGTIYMLNGGGMPYSGSYVYNDILYSYQVDGVTKNSTKMITEYYKDSYQQIIADSDPIFYQSLETISAPQWEIDNQLICVFVSTTEFDTFLTQCATQKAATMSLRMMSPRSVTNTEVSSVVSTDNISNNPVMRLTLRYDSESGLLYVQEGANTTWHLLNYQTDNNNGDYILKSSVVKKWRLPGKFSNPSLQSTKWIFQLKSKQIKALNEEDVKTAITVYARKNIV